MHLKLNIHYVTLRHAGLAFSLSPPRSTAVLAHQAKPCGNVMHYCSYLHSLHDAWLDSLVCQLSY